MKTTQTHNTETLNCVCVCTSPEAAAAEPPQSQRLKLNHLEQVCVLVCAYVFLYICVSLGVFVVLS